MSLRPSVVLLAFAAACAHPAPPPAPTPPPPPPPRSPSANAPSAPTLTEGAPASNGDLDKAIIKQTMHGQLKDLTYCYEKELLAKPNLAGTLTASFFITPDGTVSASEASGVDPEVAACVAKVIGAMVFPKPKGRGGVQVNYPFTFRPVPDDAAGEGTKN